MAMCSQVRRGDRWIFRNHIRGGKLERTLNNLVDGIANSIEACSASKFSAQICCVTVTVSPRGQRNSGWKLGL